MDNIAKPWTNIHNKNEQSTCIQMSALKTKQTHRRADSCSTQIVVGIIADNDDDDDRRYMKLCHVVAYLMATHVAKHNPMFCHILQHTVYHLRQTTTSYNTCGLSAKIDLNRKTKTSNKQLQCSNMCACTSPFVNVEKKASVAVDLQARCVNYAAIPLFHFRAVHQRA